MIAEHPTGQRQLSDWRLHFTLKKCFSTDIQPNPMNGSYIEYLNILLSFSHEKRRTLVMW